MKFESIYIQGDEANINELLEIAREILKKRKQIKKDAKPKESTNVKEKEK